jgi:prophage tail gpP-like protein
MTIEDVAVIAGGKKFSQWQRVTITAGAGQAARSATLETTEPNALFGDEWTFKPGTKVEIQAGGDQMLVDYVDDYAPQFDATSHTASISIRSKAKDAIDSSAVHDTGEIRDKDLEGIAKDLDKFGIGFKAVGISLKKIPLHRISPGSTVFQELEVLARQQGVLLVGEADGSVAITKAGKNGRHAGALQEGVNILRASATLSEKGKHSSVKVKGQRGFGTSDQALRIEHEEKDATVERYRPLIVVAEGDTDLDRAKVRAAYHIARSSGSSVSASITVKGWRDEAGALWDPKKLIFVESQRLKISQDMAIKSVSFNQSGEEHGLGTHCILSLVDPKSLGAEGKASKGKSAGAWKTGGED